ncbi:MAG: CHAD domain-containing protein [candidate division KSB1 bacterium]|nr:CHAD domain-containing protein [candidate division KSB1 bacterium]MDZ7275964.1 CHAD domain-containing protein [candidate division KSB1 bacterium]MDZ7285754.1 CHAD domain-containing protein [candidate division KSB1 bacterium]MDZ7298786.1 CHAD domain-containing protein [candidate division KSB1 bacterium]MDZ7307924.1 CHAD domain-containing protein [candidate division KSB1 bacterium]
MNHSPSLNTRTISFAPVTLSADTPPLVCARQLILERAVEMARGEEGTRRGEDIEALHDMRVWSRRLREALEIFSFCFPERQYERLYNRVRQVTRTLGAARNADVAVAYFTEQLDHATELLERFALEDLLRRLVKQQKRERGRMQQRLSKKVKVAELPAAFESVFQKLAHVSSARRRGPRTAGRLARTLLGQRLQEVFKVRAALAGEDHVEGLHNLRIAVKKLRYALEVLGFAAGEAAAGSLGFFKKLQTVLGDLHDRDVFLALVQERSASLQQQPFSSLLLQGYEKVFARLAGERHRFYAKYFELFGRATLAEWRKRLVPPLPRPATPKTEAPAPPAAVN